MRSQNFNSALPLGVYTLLSKPVASYGSLLALIFRFTWKSHLTSIKSVHQKCEGIGEATPSLTGARQWWYTPLTLALERQRQGQADLWVQGQPNLQS